MTRRQAVDFDEETAIRGFDVSHHNGLVDFELLKKEGFEWCYIRTGDGHTWDRRLAANAEGASKAGIKLGYYHYFRADRGGLLQATMVQTASRDVPPDLPPVIDIERGAWRNLPGGLFDGTGELPSFQVRGQLREFIKVLPNTVIYGGGPLHWRLTAAGYKLPKTRYWCGGALDLERPLMPQTHADNDAFEAIDIWQHTIRKNKQWCKSGRLDLNYMTLEFWKSIFPVPEVVKPSRDCEKALEKLIEGLTKEIQNALRK